MFVKLTERNGGIVMIAPNAITCIREVTLGYGDKFTSVDYSAGSTVQVQEPPEMILAKLKQPDAPR